MEDIGFGRAWLRSWKMGIEGETRGSGTSQGERGAVNNVNWRRHSEAAAEHQIIAGD